MLRDLVQLGRLCGIGLILARHDAMFVAERLPVPAVLLALGRLCARLLRRGDLPARPGERLALALTALGPTFIKTGQALSVRPDLVGKELAEDLGGLRDRLPPFPSSVARAEIASALGQSIDALYARFDDEPVAAASIAQVHFAETTDGAQVAVKVLRPGVEAAFRRDLDLFFWLARRAEGMARLQRLRPLAVVSTLADAIAIELDLRLEAAAAAELAENFKDDPELRVPAVDWQRTARRVLTIARVTGIPVADNAALDAAGIDRGRAGAAVITSFLKQAMRDGFFHADMHQGNLFIALDGALEPVDFGIMGRLDLPTRRFMAEMLLAFLTGNWQRAAEVHFEAGYVPADKSVETFAQACRSIGEPIMGRPVEEISIGRLLAQLFEITETFAMRTQPQLLLLQKTMVTAEGVARGLDPAINFWTVSQPVIEDWMRGAMGPAARIEQAAGGAMAALQRLPGLMDKVDRAATALANDGVRLDADSIARLAAEQARGRRPMVWAAWVAVALLAGLFLLG